MSTPAGTGSEASAASDVIRIKVGIAVSYIANSKREYVEEIPRAEWDAMTPEQRDALLDELAESQVADYVESWAQVEEG